MQYRYVILCARCTVRCNGFLFAVFPQWCSKAFKNVSVVPPDIGSVHQVNLEYLARAIQESEGFIYPDSVVGTDSHTTMINGLGILGWGKWLLSESQTNSTSAKCSRHRIINLHRP